MQQGSPLDQVLSVSQAAPPAWRDLFEAAMQHHRAGDLAQAEALYRQVLVANPRHDDSLHLLGLAIFQSGRRDLGLEMARQALAMSPDKATYHSNLAGMFAEQEAWDQAELCYREVIRLTPLDAVTHNRLGDLLFRQSRLDEAAACFRQATRLRPDYAEAHNNLGAVCYRQGDRGQAVACYRRALALDPQRAEMQRNLGTALYDLRQFEEAVAAFSAALALAPNDPPTLNHLGAGLLRLDRLAEAAAAFEAAIRLDPGFGDARSNLSVVYTRQAQPAESVACCRAALGATPANANAHYNLALGLLAMGAMEEGWREYEWRWAVEPGRSHRRHAEVPLWLGEPAEGRTLLVHVEQGQGDAIQFCRYIPMVRARGLRVVVEVFPSLLRLFRSLPGIDVLVPLGAPLPPFDLQCPMLSLPLAFGTTVGTIPAETPYLHPDASDAEAWRQRLLSGTAEGPCVGIVWAGSARPDWPISAEIDRRRSLPPERLAPLFAVPGLQFYSLQKDGPRLPPGFAVHDPMPQMADFADTAALVANLDLVITVDTAVAHLAGALGRPVWLLDRFDHCWRWLAGRQDSPWYPGLRVFRQPVPGDWDPVLAEVAGDLRALTEAWHVIVQPQDVAAPAL